MIKPISISNQFVLKNQQIKKQQTESVGKRKTQRQRAILMNQWKNWLKRMVAKIKGIAWKKQFLASLPYLAFGYVFDKFSWQYQREA